MWTPFYGCYWCYDWWAAAEARIFCYYGERTSCRAESLASVLQVASSSDWWLWQNRCHRQAYRSPKRISKLHCSTAGRPTQAHAVLPAVR